jgi:hypothetical protein
MIFSEAQESVLCKRVVYMCERGFPITIEGLQKVAFLYAKKLCRQKKLIKSIPLTWTTKASYEWWYGFRNRHPELALRVAENISVSRAEGFNKERISAFYTELVPIYDRLGFHHLPQLIYNCDETGLPSVPNVGKRVLAAKGSKAVYKIQVAERGTLTTLLPCVNAIGEILPTFLIFKGHHIQHSIPNNIGIL